MENKDKSKIKALHYEERMNLWENLPLKSPLAIFFEPSTYCNFKCCYCTQSLPKERFESEVRKYSNMSINVFEAALEQIREFDSKLKLVEFSGVGEPLCNKELPNMIKKLRESGLSNHIRLITNGVLLDKETSDKLIDASPTSIRVSIQGMSSEKYAEICGTKIEFGDIVSNIEYIYKNKKETELFIKNIDIALDENDCKKFYDTFENISDRMFVENIIPFFSKVDYDKILNDRQVNRYGEEKKEISVCPNTFTALVINSEGDISMCGKEVAPIYLGNVMTNGLVEAWNSKKRKDFLVSQLKKERHLNDICKDCKIPSESLASEKDILDPYSEILIDKFLK